MTWPKENFWCTTEKEIAELVEILAPAFGLGCITEDVENVWEWAEARDRDNRYWNVSRKWAEGTENEQQILRIVVDPVPADPRAFSKRLATTIGSRVSFGRVAHLTGNDFDFQEEFSSQPD
jgi:hypothetical protein